MNTIEKGDKTLVKCSNCDRPLLNILHTDPTAQFELAIKATCPCGDSSFPITVKGRFHHNVPEKIVGDTEEINLYVMDIEETDKYIVFHMGEIK